MRDNLRAAMATLSDDPFGELRGIRAPGTGVPRLIALGTWRRRGEGKDFAALRGRRPAVVVDLRGGPYRRLPVSADGAAAVTVTASIGAASGA